LATATFFLVSCGDDVQPTTFTVTIENISPPDLIDSERAQGTVPLSPIVWAQYEGDNPMFENGDKASLGTERIAEDGFPIEMSAQLGNDEDVINSGIIISPGGPDAGDALFSGESVSFSVTAGEDDKLQIITMFVQSNDWFMSLGDEGVRLFENGNPINGDITSFMRIYDAGTEEDTAPGTGDFQKPVQSATDVDLGPKEDEDIQFAQDRHPSFVIPAPIQIMKVTIQS